MKLKCLQVMSVVLLIALSTHTTVIAHAHNTGSVLITVKKLSTSFDDTKHKLRRSRHYDLVAQVVGSLLLIGTVALYIKRTIRFYRKQFMNHFDFQNKIIHRRPFASDHSYFFSVYRRPPPRYSFAS